MAGCHLSPPAPAQLRTVPVGDRLCLPYTPPRREKMEIPNGTGEATMLGPLWAEDSTSSPSSLCWGCSAPRLRIPLPQRPFGET